MRVVCVGILVADVFVPALRGFPAPGELIATDEFLLEVGGCAANTANALARLGVPSSVVGRVGDDLFGTFIKRELRRQEVDLGGVVKTRGFGTAKTIILTVSGEDRRYIHTIGANAVLCAEDLDQVAMAAGDVLYVGGYLLLPALEEKALAARLCAARALGVRTVLDVVVPSGRGAGFEQIKPLLPHVDVFLPNEDEARALTGEADPRRQATKFIASGASLVVVTRGRGGALLATRDRQVEVSAPVLDIVDGSGAGDAFAAGFICGMVEDWPLERTLTFASVIGGSACTALGCTAGIFTRRQAEEYLAVNRLLTA